MPHYFLSEEKFLPFVQTLMDEMRVMAPVAQTRVCSATEKFTYEYLEAAEDIRLDFDVTILPPKKAFFPPKQTLMTFGPDGPQSAIDPQPQVLLGVHFYDIKGIDMMDTFYSMDHPDENYLANRRYTCVIGSNIRRIAERGFWASVNPHLEPKGHDGFLTYLNGRGYVYETRTPKGDSLLKFGAFAEAPEEHVRAAERENQRVMDRCPETMPGHGDMTSISQKVRASFADEGLWGKLARDCFSCGACNIVCPTCHCFDVQDSWALDQCSGERCRSWDGCLLRGFAEVSLGGGNTENFRTARAERYRHRAMKKMNYLMDKLDGMACVGCGRCSLSCVPNIADPVHIVESVLQAEGRANVQAGDTV